MGSSEDFEARLTAVESEVAIARREATAALTLAAGADREVLGIAHIVRMLEDLPGRS